MDLISAAILLFVVMDPLGSIPIFLSVLDKVEPERLGLWSLAVLLAWAASAVILLAAPQLKRLLGQRGLIATERLMGMLLVAIAVQMFLEGVAKFLGDRV
ncbi:MAG: MarC family protein [Wenzhouxiangella sp.]